MISNTFAKAQIKRLGGLDFFPSEPAAVRELVGALETASSEDSARAVIDKFINERTLCPKPCELREMALAGIPQNTEFRGYEPVPVECSMCGDWGHLAQGSIQVRCECPAGLALDQKYLSHLNSYKPRISAAKAMKPITREDFATLGRKA